MVVPTNVRFPAEAAAELADYARRTGSKRSTVVVRAVREWLRMQDHHGIVFVSTVTGERRATLAAGPQVWTVAEAWQQHRPAERSAAMVADALGLGVTDVEAALGYWADHRDEVDELIRRHHEDQDEALDAWERRRALDAL